MLPDEAATKPMYAWTVIRDIYEQFEVTPRASLKAPWWKSLYWDVLDWWYAFRRSR